MTSTEPKQPNHNLTRRARNLTLVLSLGMLAGILIWAKLRLVTDIPRSAYADPREVQPPESPVDLGGQETPVDPQLSQNIEGQIEPLEQSPTPTRP